MKRILFVDDEVEVLDSLRLRLYKHRGEWDMIFVGSGAAVFDELDKGAVDLIVADVRMPGIDGGELLRVMQAHWPETIRIILSGYAEREQVLKLVPLAHQYVAKPCDAQRLENIIERCLSLQAMLQKSELRAAVGHIGSLPPVPKLYAELQAMLIDPNASTNSLADLIAHDPAIATKVLQVANSAFFRLAKPVTRVKEAVAYLGFGSIRNLVMSAAVFAKWEQLRGVPGVSVEALQQHALTAAAATMALCPDSALADDAWLAGLVHDIGYWILLAECPEKLQQALDLARAKGIDSCAAERQVFGVTHAEIGAYLLGLWGLPYPLVEAVALHHSPERIKHHGFDLPAMVSVAHTLMPMSLEDGLNLSSETAAIMTPEEFQALKPPFDWHEATERVLTACSPATLIPET